MNRRLGTLVSCVVIAHLTFFFFDFSERSSPPRKSSLVVHTYIAPAPKIKKRARKTHTKISQKQKVLKELGKTLAKIKSRQKEVTHTQLEFPHSIDQLQVDQNEANYFSIITSTLKEALELPELGSVKLELILSNSGQVLKVRVDHAESEKNKHYLEQQLMFFEFPPFTEDLKNEKTHTFVLTFCNEK